MFARFVRDERPAALHWAGFTLTGGIAFVFIAQRTDPHTWWVYVGANVCFLVSLVVLRRGVQVFTRSHSRGQDREAALILAIAIVALVAASPSDEGEPWRAIVMYCISALILGRAASEGYGARVRLFGKRFTWALTVTTMLLVGLCVARAIQQALNWDGAYGLHAGGRDAVWLLLAYLVGSISLNFAFMALIISRLILSLRDQAGLDSLTGLANRRVLDAELEREWQRLQRGGRTFAILALDLDFLKRINDAYGHYGGDAALQTVGVRLRGVVRENDTVARIGGDEFIVLLPETGVSGALAVAQKFVVRMRGEPLELAGRSLPLTVSVGVSLARSDDDSVLDVMRRADGALYRAKIEGRDRVALDAPLSLVRGKDEMPLQAVSRPVSF